VLPIRFDYVGTSSRVPFSHLDCGKHAVLLTASQLEQRHSTVASQRLYLYMRQWCEASQDWRRTVCACAQKPRKNKWHENM
jgi:hypothetical protein